MKGKINILELFYPPICHFCGKPGRQELCRECRKEVVYVEEPRCMRCGKPISTFEQEYCHDCNNREYAYEEGRSLWVHKGKVPWSIYQFKYHNRRYFSEFYAREWVRLYGTWIQRQAFDIIIPIPLHRKRFRKRGYNQAEVLGRELSKRTGIPLAPSAVKRIHNTRPQKQLRPGERRRNLERAFEVSDWDERWNNILLIDDIYTTGSTINSVARLLKGKGARKVCFLTISIGQGF